MKKLFLIFTLLMISVLANARKFYFSASGSDSYSTTQAQNPATPWQTLSKLNSLSSIAAAGDTFAFKRGETFANGTQYGTVGSVKWFGGGYEGRNFPSGTAQNPIVFTYYGDMSLDRPNLLYPYPTTTAGNERNVLAFANVSYIIVDGIQFNDTRFPVNDKRSGAYTCTGLWFGDSGYCGTSEGCRCFDITVKNCNFSNIVYGIVSFVRGFVIDNNTFSNFKSTGVYSDTATQSDIGADPIICSGSKFRITNNRITGSWAYANPFTSSSAGLLGGALETINNFDSSLVAYNTFIDCGGGMEFGTNLPGGVQGPNDDTICYNKFINCSNICYLNTSGTYATQGKNLHFWNNFFVEGSKSRMSGYGAGGDALGDGQTYANTGFIYWPPYPINKSTRYPDSLNFQSAWRPIAVGSTSGQAADTVFDIKNNVFWINNGLYAKYTSSERGKVFYRNNIYHLVSGYQGAVGSFTATALGTSGVTLATGERIINSKLIVDSSSVYPQNWDMRITSDTSYAAANGMNVGLTRDFVGNAVDGSPSIGIYEYNGNPSTSCSFTYGSWATCTNNVQTRSYTSSPSGCTTTPPADSILRTCGSTCVVVYSPWSGCVNGAQTRTYTVNAGCTIIPPVDSLQRACNVTCISYSYGTWTACVNGLQTRSYSTLPIGCNLGTPPTDSISRNCTLPSLSFTTTSVKRASCLNRTDGQIVISISGGVGPYYTSINSTLVYVQGQTTFSGLLPGTYTIRVKDSTGVIVTLTVTVGSRRNRRC